MKWKGFLAGVLFFIFFPQGLKWEEGWDERKEEVKDCQGLSRSGAPPSELGREK